MLPIEALRDIFAEDKTILVTGPKGEGKTNLAGVIKQTLVLKPYSNCKCFSTHVKGSIFSFMGLYYIIGYFQMVW